MSDGSEKRPLTKMLWSVSIETLGHSHRLIHVMDLFKVMFKASEAISNGWTNVFRCA